MREKDKEKVVDFYKKKINKYGPTYKGFGMGCQDSQYKRFEVFLEIGDLNNSRILDVGCGAGDFFNFLKKKGLNVEYYGCDILKEGIEFAKKKYPDGNFFEGNVDKFLNQEFDYVFESGTFNVYFGDNDSLAKNNIEKMYSIAKKGIGINFLSKFRFDKIVESSEEGYRFDPGEYFNYARSLSQKVILKHNYMPNDFTIFMYKDNDF